MDTAIREQQPANFWIFYPLKGLRITDETHDLDSPMFGDATIVSTAHVPQIMELVKTYDPSLSAKDAHDMALIMTHGWDPDAFDSLVAVRRNLHLYSRGSVKHFLAPTEVIAVSEKRANEIAAALSLLFFANRTDRLTCGLLQHILRPLERVSVLGLESPIFMYANVAEGSHTITIARDCIRVSRAELGAACSQRPCQSLMRLLLCQDRLLPRSLDRAITASAIRLAEALHTARSASQLLGAVTAIEILTTTGEGFAAAERRVSALLGEVATTPYSLSAVLEARHRYVHEGRDVSSELALAGIILALLTLLQFAEYASPFADKAAFLGYLDFIHAGSQLLHLWDDNDRQHLTKLLRHSPWEGQLPCMAPRPTMGSAEVEADASRDS